MVEAKQVVIGQRIAYKGDMANASGKGVVVAVRNDGPLLRRISFSAGGLSEGSSASFDVVLDDGRSMGAVSALNIGGEFGDKSCRFMFIDGVAGAEEIAQLQAGVAMKKAADQAKASAAAAAFAAAKEAAKAEGVALGLVPVAEFKGRGSAAASNLRAEMKKAGIKCSVKQDGFDCINVRLVDDKDCEQAKKIADKYQAGNFNGMEDIYEYSANAWGSVFGDVRYAFVKSEAGYLR